MPRTVPRHPDSALTVLFDRHAAALLAFARSYVGDTAAAEDVVQQTFLAAHRTLTAGTRLEQPRAWLFHVARNNALMVLRERGGLRSADAALAEELEARAAEVADQVVEREELREVVADIVALPAEQRAALTLSELGDLSQAEIAIAIGVERRKVKALVFQARSALTDQRAARDASCQTVRKQLATMTGGRLNNRLIRNHLRRCAGCTAYRDELRDRRRKVALLLPLPLLPGLREAVLGKGAVAAVAAGHGAGTGAVAWLAGKPKWLAAGTTTAATATVVGALVLGGAGPVRPTVKPAERPATAFAAVTTPAPAPGSAQAARRHTRTRTSARSVAARPAQGAAPRLRVLGMQVQGGGHVPERTRDAPAFDPSPGTPAPSLTPGPTGTPEPSVAPDAGLPTAPGSAPEPAASEPAAPAPSATPVATSSPSPTPWSGWPPGHRPKGDDHPAHPPHP
ncbi:MAG: hypothetical protein QOE86_3577 [Solirubrobacteraceae bacterium]|jgi:RNA polymerase sigma factor (sigma-70 family)|nr:hypothetical protein [Solirubrobacteraceae bacterium]